MATKRSGEPWMSADDYGRAMPSFTVNLLVADLERSVAFYSKVLGAAVDYWDVDFAALHVAGLEFMVHADHTYEHHPWYPEVSGGARRGLGAELRLFGIDPDKTEARAREVGAVVLQGSMDKPHGWRDVIVADPDGYAWAIGVPKGK
jgi:catechol 2,3-dioxygenase-like lactoylglutathione lyase family enzyme